MSFVLIGALALVLAACQANLGEADTGTGVEFTRLDAATPEDFQSLAHSGPVEIFGAGMGNEFGVLANPAKIDLGDVGQIEKVLLQVILKWADEDAVVTFEDAEVGGTVLAEVPYLAAKEFITGNYFEAELLGSQVPASGEIWARVNEAGEKSDPTASTEFAPRSFVAFAFYEDGDPSVTTKGGIGYADIYFKKLGEGRVPIYDEVIVFDPAPVDRQVVISFALSEVEDDERVADVEVFVGGVQEFYERFVKSDEDEVSVRRIVEVLPAGETTIVVRASSPGDDLDPAGAEGDSFFLAGATASVTEPPDDEEFFACTPGYWRNHAGMGPGPQPNAWEGYDPTDLFSSAFDRTITISLPRRQSITDPTLHQAVTATGGGVNALARSAVAALLNAAHSEVNYPYSVAEVIAMVQDAIDGGDVRGTASYLDDVNNAYVCPL